MAYMKLQAKREFALQVLSKLTDSPQTIENVAASIGKTRGQLIYVVKQLIDGGMAFSKIHYGIYRNTKIDISLDYIEKKMTELRINNRNLHRRFKKALREEANNDPLTNRRCRGCKDFLTASRYFTCVKCEPELQSIDEDYIYQGAEQSFVDDVEVDDCWGEWENRELEIINTGEIDEDV